VAPVNERGVLATGGRWDNRRWERGVHAYQGRWNSGVPNWLGAGGIGSQGQGSNVASADRACSPMLEPLITSRAVWVFTRSSAGRVEPAGI
jgi:hypothetical protein